MSDHFSGLRAIAGPAGDVCDVYAFPSPDRPGHLVLARTGENFSVEELNLIRGMARLLDLTLTMLRTCPVSTKRPAPRSSFRRANRRHQRNQSTRESIFSSARSTSNRG